LSPWKFVILVAILTHNLRRYGSGPWIESRNGANEPDGTSAEGRSFHSGRAFGLAKPVLKVSFYFHFKR